MQFNVPKNVYVNLDGRITAFTHQDPDPDENLVLDIDQNWEITVEWHLTGLGAASAATGKWYGEVTVESRGENEEKTLVKFEKDGISVEPISTPTHMHYKEVIAIPKRDPADLTKTDRINKTGVYMLTVILTHKMAAFPTVADPIAGFLEGPILQFYSLT